MFTGFNLSRTPLVFWLLVAFILAGAATSVPILADTYYIDCETGDDNNSGAAPAHPWRSLSKASSTALLPGDEVLFKRGTHCKGHLNPSGSGNQDNPLLLGTYGIGALPILEAAEDKPVLQLFNQEYWHIQSLELVGGSLYGLLITGDKGVLRHFRLQDLVIRGVTGQPPNKRTGLLSIIAGSKQQTFEDIVIDGVTAYDTTQWAGIVVDGGAPPLPRGAEGKNPPTLRARKVTVRNSIVHDIGGDGIILFRVENGTIERCLSWNTGMMNTQSDAGPQNPNAIWTWNCHNCKVQFNEGFFADTPGVDGGVYDIDWGSRNSVIQFNYGHDSQGYCLSVFGAGGAATTNSIVRYNVCVNNGRSPRLAERQGDIYLATWGGGSLDGVEIYNNTIYWNPPTDAPALRNEAEFVGNLPNLFQDNIIYSTAPTLVESNDSMDLLNNLYWYTGKGSPYWRYGKGDFEGAKLYQEAHQISGEEYGQPFSKRPEPNSLTPFLFQPRSGSRALDSASGDFDLDVDFFGKPVPSGASPEIGAVEHYLPEESSLTSTMKDGLSKLKLRDLRGDEFEFHASELQGRWWLIAFLSPPDKHAENRQSWNRTQIVALKSAHQQFGKLGLKVAAVISGGSSLDEQQVLNLRFDLALGSIPLLADPESRLSSLLKTHPPSSSILTSPEGKILRFQKNEVFPQIGLVLRGGLGAPAGTPEVKID
jgi:hypothetical protein